MAPAIAEAQEESRRETLTIAATRSEQHAVRAIARLRGESVSALLRPRVLELVREYESLRQMFAGTEVR